MPWFPVDMLSSSANEASGGSEVVLLPSPPPPPNLKLPKQQTPLSDDGFCLLAVSQGILIQEISRD